MRSHCAKTDRNTDPAPGRSDASPSARRAGATRLQPLLDVASAGARALQANRRPVVAALPESRAAAPDDAGLVAHARRRRPDGRVQDAARSVRQLHGERVGPLVRPRARPGARWPGRLLLRRVRAQRVDGHLLRGFGRPRRRPPEGCFGHGHPVRRGRPFLSTRLLPTDHRCRWTPGARLPGLRPTATAAAPSCGA